MSLSPSMAAELTPQQKVQKAQKAAADLLGNDLGRPVFLRLIKENRELELWLQKEGNWYCRKVYPIAGMSGQLGPKQAEGDGQAPEGFYRVRAKALNPMSRYHLSFNIGYPNRYDRDLGRSGSFIMIHGSNVSIGCFAMTDAGIEEIYGAVAAALEAGQSYAPVQIYPFRMTPERMEAEKEGESSAFWQHLLPAWQYTEEKAAPYPDTDN